MAKFHEHVEQAKRNLLFLKEINEKIDDSYDWQVTVCFYAALHLVNAHLSKFGMQYRRHQDTNHALNPYNQVSPTKIPEEEYVSYTALQSLARRSRYLVNEKDDQIASDKAFMTYEKHLAKAIGHLDKLANYFKDKYDLDLPDICLKCSSIGSTQHLNHIEIES